MIFQRQHFPYEKQADLSDILSDPRLQYSLAGAAGGGLIGLLLQRLRDKKKRNYLGGALGGAAIGGLGGLGLSMLRPSDATMADAVAAAEESSVPSSKVDFREWVKEQMRRAGRDPSSLEPPAEPTPSPSAASPSEPASIQPASPGRKSPTSPPEIAHTPSKPSRRSAKLPTSKVPPPPGFVPPASIDIPPELQDLVRGLAE